MLSPAYHMSSLAILSLVVLIGLTLVNARTADMVCVDACVDYSVTLGYCRGAFEFNRMHLPFFPSPKSARLLGSYGLLS